MSGSAYNVLKWFENRDDAESESEGGSIVTNALRPIGILQARILEWVDFPFSRGSSQPRDRTQVSCIAG